MSPVPTPEPMTTSTEFRYEDIIDMIDAGPKLHWPHLVKFKDSPSVKLWLIPRDNYIGLEWIKVFTLRDEPAQVMETCEEFGCNPEQALLRLIEIRKAEMNLNNN